MIEPVAGGAFKSTRELCHGLVSRGWRIAIVHQSLDGDRLRSFHRRLTNLAYKLGRPWALVRLVDAIGSRRRPSAAGDLDCWQSAVVENGTIARIRREPPDLLVVTAVSRTAWTRLREVADEMNVPVVFYIRGQTMIEHLSLAKPPDAIVVNSRALASEVERAGYQTSVVYSVIDLTRYEVGTSRESVLVVNPNRQYGGDLALEVAKLAPDLPFEFRESHSLDDAGRRDLERRVRDLDNVSLLPVTSDVSELYGRTRVLMVPYDRADLKTNRPRVVIEAQRSGIPTIGSDIPGLAEAIGRAGVLVDPDRPAAWVAQLRRIFTDEEWYLSLSQVAVEQSLDPAITPDGVVDAFVDAVAPLFARFRPDRPAGLMGTAKHRGRVLRQRTRIRTALRRGSHSRVVVVHQPGHVGSNSVTNALRAVPQGPIVLHPHELAGPLNAHPPAFLPRASYEVDEQELCRAFRRRPDLPINIITMVRDPVARNITAFLFHHRLAPGGEVTADVVTDLVQRFRAEWLSRREPFERFFSGDFLPTWRVELTDFERDPRTGAFWCEKLGRTFLVLRTEDLADAHRAIAEHLHVPVGPIQRENRGEKLGYASLRTQFERALELPEEYLDRMYGSAVVRYFYNELEIRQMREKWVSVGQSDT